MALDFFDRRIFHDRHQFSADHEDVRGVEAQKEASMMNRVVIVVEGGLIKDVAADKDLEVIVVDVDKISESNDLEEIQLDYGRPDAVGRKEVDRFIAEGEDLVEEYREKTKEWFKKHGR
ncbi:MAG: hypothetical protein ACRD1Z_04810 [Vicinamibacteria bacterium]